MQNKKIINKIIASVLSLTMFLGLTPIPSFAAPTEESVSFSYTGDVQTFTVSENGVYSLEAWGASGGGAETQSNGAGSGGYTKILINLYKDDVIYVHVGEAGKLDKTYHASYPATYNGGAATVWGDNTCNPKEDGWKLQEWNNGSGGGATDFRTAPGAWDDPTSLASRIAIAGGGGGLYWEYSASAPQSLTNPTLLEESKGNNANAGVGGPTKIKGKQGFNVGDAYSTNYNYYVPGGGGGYSEAGAAGMDRPWMAGSGGGRYFDEETVDQKVVVGGNVGNGKAKITYVSPIYQTVYFECTTDSSSGAIGQIDGSIPTSTGKCTVKWEYGQTYTIPEGKKEHWRFLYWTDLDDSSKKYYAGDSYTVNSADHFALLAHYVWDGNAVFYQKTTTSANGKINHYIHVNNIDDGIEKYVSFLASADNGLTYNKVNTNGAMFSDSDVYKSFSAGQTATIPIKGSGTYKIDLYGGAGAAAYSSGGNAYCDYCGRTHYSSAGGGSNGGSISATSKLRYGDTIYVNIGTNASGITGGFNGGGSAPGSGGYSVARFAGHNGWHGGGFENYWNQYEGSAWDRVTGTSISGSAAGGAGGGASDVRLNNSSVVGQIVVANGGGGGSAVSGGYYGDSTGGRGGAGKSSPSSNGQRLVGSNGGRNKDGRSHDGAGGGGYYGGKNDSNGGYAGTLAAVTKFNRTTAALSSGYGTSNSPRGSITYLDTDTKVLAMDADFLIEPYDTIAPTEPEKLKVGTVNEKFRIGWINSKDNGEKYFYKATIHDKSNDAKLYDCEDRDNPGSLALSIDSTSGLKGYYYIYTTTNTTYDVGASIKTYLVNNPEFNQDVIDNNGTSVGQIVAGQQVLFTSSDKPYHEIPSPNLVTVYIYVAAVDFAGNISTTAKFELLPGYDIMVDPNGGVYKGSEDPVSEHGSFGSSVPIPNPTRNGFEFIGWDISGMDDEIHYYDKIEATTSSPYTYETSIDHNTITPDIKAFMDLRHTAGDVSFKAIWKDTKAPEQDNISGSGTGTFYAHKEDGTNPDGTLYATFTTADGSTYTPGTWTNKTVQMDMHLFDGTGFSKVSISVQGESDITNDNLGTTPISASSTRTITYGPSESISINTNTDSSLGAAGIEINYNTPTAHSILDRQHAVVSATFTNTGKYDGKVGATDNAGNDNYLKDIRNWVPDTSNHSSTFDYGQILIDKEAPTATVSYSDTDWTNEDVTVYIHAHDSHSGLHATAYSWDHGATWTDDNTKTFSEMTADCAYVRDAVGNWMKIWFKVGNIDKYEPWTEDMYHIHSTTSELHEWQNTPGGIVFEYTSNDIADPGSSSKASGVSQMILFKADESFNKLGQLEEVSAPYIAPSMTVVDPDSEPDFPSYEEPLTITFIDDVQGTTYYVLETYDRAGNVTTVDLVYKWDVTAPKISDPYVHQTILDEFTEAEVETAIAGELYCYFNYMLDDRNRLENASKMTSEEDSSGIEEVVLVLMNASDTSQKQEYKFTTNEIKFLNNWISKNTAEHVSLENTADAEAYAATGAPEVANDLDAILSGYVAAQINTYESFPGWAAIKWVVYAIDRAGNSTNDNYTSLENISGEEIKNFSIKTVIYSDEEFEGGKLLNILQNTPGEVGYGNNLPYFRTGDVGHTKTWTVGYVEELYTDFGNVGKVSANNIISSKLLPKYNIGLFEPEPYLSFKRSYDYSIGTEVPSGRMKYNGVPYATKYESDGWWDRISGYSYGTSVRISPYYEMSPLPGQFKADGTPKYEQETHTYKATAKKGSLGQEWETSSVGMYVIFDTAASEIHYRVTHEHHGSVSKTVE